MPLRIEDYGLIGDCEAAALVGRDGSIDWLCWPRFDSPACFAALLGTPEHGRWLIAACDPDARRSWRYRPGTLILETEIDTARGAVTVTDFMPPRGNQSDVVRLVTGRRGRVEMRTELVLRFDYGSVVPWVTRHPAGGITAIAGPDLARLATPVALHGEDMKTVGSFTVAAGETVPFVLAHGVSYLPLPEPGDGAVLLADTEEYWTTWSGRCAAAGEWSDAVSRSLITLKALTYAPTGGIVAAPTTSLPEQLGGSRNWDYRYCWLRDATLTLLALMNAGYFEEAQAWRDWLLRAVAGRPDQLQIMYSITGKRRLPEWHAEWLPGYEGAAPVRIGNGAAGQLQLDVYGEVADALYQAHLNKVAPVERGAAVQRALLDYLESNWRQADEGIWEVRGPRQQFTHSKVMAWVAFDRSIKLAERGIVKGPLNRWRAACKAIHAEVCANAYDSSRGSFTQAYGSAALDASLLLMPIVGFLPPDDPRMRGTVAAIERELMADGFVLRYDTGRTDDGLPPGEGAFLACSFWLADNYVLQHRLDEARALFERLLSLRNDLGLLAEEYDPRSGRQVGNYPQAFSHIALANTAFNLSRVQGPAEQRAETAS